ADWILKNYPLAGEYQPTSQENTILYQAAQEVAQNFLKPYPKTTKSDQVILFVATVQMAKTWRETLDETLENHSLWADVYTYFGIKVENHTDTQTQKVYASFRKTIKETLERYHRYFAPSETMRYYTTLFLHAFAPKSSLEVLFDLLFDFYTKGLDFHYSPKDLAFKTFVIGMQSRWNADKSADIHIKSGVVSSGLKVLFTQCPEFMEQFCDKIVGQMDALLRDDDSNFHPETNYVDTLVLNWYQSLSSTIRQDYGGRKKGQKVEYIATSKGKISIIYLLENNQVSLMIHRIRLEQEISSKPVVVVSQDGREISRSTLVIRGSKLVYTTDSLLIPLEQTSYDFSAPSNLKVEILVDGEVFHETEDKLHRPYLIFNEKGLESQPKEGTILLFAPESSQIQGSEHFYQFPHKGQLLRLDLDKNTHFTLDNREIFVGQDCADTFRHHCSIPALRGICGETQGQEILLFDQPFQLTIHIPENENPLQYQISIDGERTSATKFLNKDSKTLEITITGENFQSHTIALIDLVSQRQKYQFHYAVLEGCHWEYSQECYCDQLHPVEGVFFFGEQSVPISFPLHSSQHEMTFHLKALSFGLHLAPPLIYCRLGEENAFSMPKFLWHEAHDLGALLHLTTPSSLKSSIFLGSHQVHSNDGKIYELGNSITARTLPDSELDLVLKWSTGTEVHSQILTTVVFQPKFLQSPLEFQDDLVYWRLEGNYIGMPSTEYVLDLQLINGKRYQQTLPSNDCLVAIPCQLPMGQYPYTISIEKEELFCDSTQEIIYQGALLSGDPNQLLVEGMEFSLTRGTYWDLDQKCYKNINLQYNAGILTNLEYQGESCPNGETSEYPYYRATLSFETPYGKRQTFNQGQSNHFEEINPVHLWILNDYLLILLASTKGGLLVDTNYRTICNRTPLDEKKCEVPDYFEYEKRRSDYYV
ncbi:MAG: hypothetical protein R3Y07_02685, partial [Eubacteriales bacterium]